MLLNRFKPNIILFCNAVLEEGRFETRIYAIPPNSITYIYTQLQLQPICLFP